jgi:hypothetical protein
MPAIGRLTLMSRRPSLEPANCHRCQPPLIAAKVFFNSTLNLTKFEIQFD